MPDQSGYLCIRMEVSVMYPYENNSGYGAMGTHHF